ncbi:MAG: hypothetical protein AB7T07_07450 [Steroidobacteraceae bacterium]
MCRYSSRVQAVIHLRIAKPILLVSTPIGVVWGVVEAYRFKPTLAALMCLLLSVISAFIWYTVRTVRREQQHGHPSSNPTSQR